MPRKLGKALARRAELQARLGEVRDRLWVSAPAQEGDQPAEDPEPLLTELGAIAVELEKLIVDINRTNAVAHVVWKDADRGLGAPRCSWTSTRSAQSGGGFDRPAAGALQPF
jgi:hypothetical protein